MPDARNYTVYTPNQHCTYPNQDGVEDYSFSHTASYCGMPQPRLCGCAFCYGDESDDPDREQRMLWKEAVANDETTDGFSDWWVLNNA